MSSATTLTDGTAGAPERARTVGVPRARVVFVGVGPGDPDLLTVRAADVVGRARVLVVPDAAAADRWAVLAAGAQVVGLDAVGGPEARARRLAELAHAGDGVVRVVPGDVLSTPGAPEELAACRAAGVGVSVVPGIAAVTAWTTFAGVAPVRDGVPLHVLDLRQHAGDGPDGAADAVSAALRAGGSAVVLGSGRAVGQLESAVAGTLADAAPALATRSPGTARQSSSAAGVGSATGSLAAPEGAPGDPDETLLVMGPAAAPERRLDWFESRPLFGWRVLVPRTRQQAGAMDAALLEQGAVPEEVPTICVEPPRTPQQVDKAIRGLVEGSYEWVVFTSTNALRAVREKFRELGLDARAMSGLKIAAVGEATAAALRGWGIEPDLVPRGESSAAGLVAEFPDYDDVLDPIDRVLLPRADIATDTLVAGLRERGWTVDDVTAYRTVRAAPPPAPVRDAIKTGRFDAVLFTSSSTVRNLVGIAGKPHASTVVACIGPQTARTAAEHGLRVAVTADSPSAPELVRALAGWAAERADSLAAAGRPVVPPSRSRPARRPARPKPAAVAARDGAGQDGAGTEPDGAVRDGAGTDGAEAPQRQPAGVV